jgi:hypothetical protein
MNSYDRLGDESARLAALSPILRFRKSIRNLFQISRQFDGFKEISSAIIHVWRVRPGYDVPLYGLLQQNSSFRVIYVVLEAPLFQEFQ